MTVENGWLKVSNKEYKNDSGTSRMWVEESPGAWMTVQRKYFVQHGSTDKVEITEAAFYRNGQGIYDDAAKQPTVGGPKIKAAWKKVGSDKWHREDGPAFITEEESGEICKCWLLHGLTTRVDGPAIERSSSKNDLYYKGKFFGFDGERDSILKWKEAIEKDTLVRTEDEVGNVLYKNKDGQLHRTFGPAVEYKDGGFQWYQNNRLHREGDEPTTLSAYGNGTTLSEWIKNGFHTRDNAPAFVEKTKDGRITVERFYKDGKLHRFDGPVNESGIYALYGQTFTKEEFDQGVAKIQIEGATHYLMVGEDVKEALYHNCEGPALIDANGTETFYIYGHEYEPEEHQTICDEYEFADEADLPGFDYWHQAKLDAQYVGGDDIQEARWIISETLEDGTRNAIFILWAGNVYGENRWNEIINPGDHVKYTGQQAFTSACYGKEIIKMIRMFGGYEQAHEKIESGEFEFNLDGTYVRFSMAEPDEEDTVPNLSFSEELEKIGAAYLSGLDEKEEEDEEEVIDWANAKLRVETVKSDLYSDMSRLRIWRDREGLDELLDFEIFEDEVFDDEKRTDKLSNSSLTSSEFFQTEDFQTQFLKWFREIGGTSPAYDFFDGDENALQTLSELFKPTPPVKKPEEFGLGWLAGGAAAVGLLAALSKKRTVKAAAIEKIEVKQEETVKEEMTK